MSTRPSLFAGGNDGGKPIVSGVESSTGSDPNSVNPAEIGSGEPIAENARIEPENGGGNIDPTTGKRKYRKRGATQKAETLNVDGLAGILFSGHLMLAAITKTSELALDNDEAKQLATASANVAKHYNMLIDPKTADWANLIMVMGMVYGTRLMAIRMRRTTERRDKPEPEKPQGEASIYPPNMEHYPQEGPYG